MVERDNHIPNLGASLVREYLFRTGLKCTLKCMDDELPRSPESLNNRVLLARELKIEHLLYEYKQANITAKSVLEIMLSVFLNKSDNSIPVTPKNSSERSASTCSYDKWSRIYEAVRISPDKTQQSQMINIDRMLWFYRQLSDRGVKIDFHTLVRVYCNCFSNATGSDIHQTSNNIGHGQYLIPDYPKGTLVTV